MCRHAHSLSIVFVRHFCVTFSLSLPLSQRHVFASVVFSDLTLPLTYGLDKFRQWVYGRKILNTHFPRLHSDLLCRQRCTQWDKNPSENIQSLKFGLCDVYGVIESNILECIFVSDKINVLSSTPLRQCESFMLQQMQYTHTLNTFRSCRD